MTEEWDKQEQTKDQQNVDILMFLRSCFMLLRLMMCFHIKFLKDIQAQRNPQRGQQVHIKKCGFYALVRAAVLLFDLWCAKFSHSFFLLNNNDVK